MITSVLQQWLLRLLMLRTGYSNSTAMCYANSKDIDALKYADVVFRFRPWRCQAQKKQPSVPVGGGDDVHLEKGKKLNLYVLALI